MNNCQPRNNCGLLLLTLIFIMLLAGTGVSIAHGQDAEFTESTDPATLNGTTIYAEQPVPSILQSREKLRSYIKNKYYKNVTIDFFYLKYTTYVPKGFISFGENVAVKHRSSHDRSNEANRESRAREIANKYIQNEPDLFVVTPKGEMV